MQFPNIEENQDVGPAEDGYIKSGLDNLNIG